MALKRVIAYPMHEHELAFAVHTLARAETSGNLVVGSADEAAIQLLRDKGLVVEVLPERTDVQRQAFKRTLDLWAPRSTELFSTRGPPSLGPPLYFLITLEGPMLESWRRRLAELGIHAFERDPAGELKVRLRPEQVPPVAELDFVADLRRMEPGDAGPEIVSMPVEQRSPGVGVTPTPMLTFDIRLNQAEDFQGVHAWLVRRRVAVAGNSRRKIRVHLLADAPEIRLIPRLEGVARLEEYVAPKFHNDVARRLMAIDAIGVGAGSVQETGKDQIVAVADTGLDVTHPDFAGRILAAVAKGSPTAADPHGHGTHVAGSVLGDGAASGGQFRGAAPSAQLYFQALLAPDGSIGGLPLDLGDLFEEAYLQGARVHNNSWGSATSSRYTMSSSEVDEFVARRRDMLVVFSAGNEGSGANPVRAAAGFVDWLSIGSPASSKNALTVGASRSDRTTGGYAKYSYGATWPDAFPHPPTANDTVSGNPECIAAFSSRGPCDDQRIKPDVVAPGTDIASARSSTGYLGNFWGVVPDQPKYGFMGGTSMAAPLVSGCAALVREYYVSTRQHLPSAALLKATLINGARWLSGADALAPRPGTPNFHQGFGRVDVAASIPQPGSLWQLQFDDAWQAGAGLTQTGEARRYELKLGPNVSSLRICLAYTDHPARALQNNLNLFLERPDGSKVVGNHTLPDAFNPALNNLPDGTNNVEVIRLDALPSGTYRLQVLAQNLLKPPQDFALVVLGDGIVAFTPI